VSPSRLPLPSAAGLLGLALLVAACGADDPDAASSAATLDPAVATALADQADRLADHVRDGEDCDALDEADLLYAAAREGAADGTVPEEVAREVEDVTAAVTRDLTCEEPAEEPETDDEPDGPAEPAPDEGGGNGGNGGKGEGNDDKGKGNDGKGKG
jgi:hypothetical protein